MSDDQVGVAIVVKVGKSGPGGSTIHIDAIQGTGRAATLREPGTGRATGVLKVTDGSIIITYDEVRVAIAVEVDKGR